MYAFIKGSFVFKSPALVWLECNGIGYEVFISLHTYSQIQTKENGILYTYFQVKEDAHTLYGFFDEEERQLFIQLISVSGIGGGTARMMLSGMKPDEIMHYIATENEAMLSKIKGIGPKTAKRIILELKDKVGKMKSGEQIVSIKHNKTDVDALNALMSLGIARAQAISAVQKAMQQNENSTLEELIKNALKNI